MLDPTTTTCLLLGRYEGLDVQSGKCNLRINPEQVRVLPAAFAEPLTTLSKAPTLSRLREIIAAVGTDPDETVESLLQARIIVRLVPSQEPLAIKEDLAILLAARLYTNLEFVGPGEGETALVRSGEHAPWPVSIVTLGVLISMGEQPIANLLSQAATDLGLADAEAYELFAADLPRLLRKGAAYLGIPGAS